MLRPCSVNHGQLEVSHNFYFVLNNIIFALRVRFTLEDSRFLKTLPKNRPVPIVAFDFYRAAACNATHGIAVAMLSVYLSVCLSVCLSDACIVTK